MSWRVFNRAMEIAQNNNIPTINFFGGEPLLNPHVVEMTHRILGNGFYLILATNCRPFLKVKFFSEFLDITRPYKKKIQIFTAKDKFHLQYFDPSETINKLLSEKYDVTVSTYCDDSILLSEKNIHNQDLTQMNTSFSCCNGKWTDYLGVLPNGGWTICPPSLKTFGNIFNCDIEEIIKFKAGLPLKYRKGCTECLKDFNKYHILFEAILASGKNTDQLR